MFGEPINTETRSSNNPNRLCSITFKSHWGRGAGGLGVERKYIIQGMGDIIQCTGQFCY